MRLLEEFSNEQAKTLINQAIVFDSSEYEDLNSSNLKVTNKNFENWAKNKEKLFELLGNKLIIEKEVEYEITDRNKQFEQMDNLIIQSQFLKELKEKLKSYCQSDTAVEIILHTTHCSTCLIDNVVNSTMLNKNESIVFEISETQKIKIQNGMKAMRLFHKLSKAFNISEDLFNDFTIKHSQILASKKQKDTLCLSIHPFDFATMSDNENKWKSCMSWVDSGCYRLGTVEMMQSPYILEAYIPSKTETFEFADGTEWNSKKWRELIIVSDNLILPIKAYPFECPSLETIILNWLQNIRAAKNLSPLVPALYNWRQHKTYINSGKEDERAIETRIRYSLMYNDLASFGNKMKPCLICDDEDLDIHLNEDVQCMSCGDYDVEFKEDHLLCENCEEKYCGIQHYECSWCSCDLDEPEYTDPDGNPICENCYNEHTYYCDCCNGFYWLSGDEHCVTVYTKWGEDCITLCEECYNDYIERGEIQTDEYGDEYIDRCS